MKTCSKCKIEKELVDFPKRKDSKDGRNAMCKDCVNKRNINNVIGKRYRENNPDKIKSSNKKQYEKNSRVEYKKLYYNENIEILREKKKIYIKNNKDKLNKQRRIRYKERLECDITYHLLENIRGIVRTAFKRKDVKKTKRTNEILGCSYQEFLLYLESKFESWMNWDNRGLYNGEFNYGWDIDHIIPLSNAKSEEDVYKLNYYTNLQPLCSKINRDIKKDKLI